MLREIQVDTDYMFTETIYSYSVAVIPVSASVVIYNNSGTSVSSGSCTIDGTTGLISYLFSSTDNDTVGDNYKLALTYQIGSTEYIKSYLFDVAKNALVNDVVDSDLYTYLPALRKEIYEHSGTTDSTGTTTTLIDSALKAESREWVGGYVELVVGSTLLYTREARIVSYANSTGTITFSPAMPSAVGANVMYSMRSSYQRYIDEAFDYVIKAVRKRVPIAGKYIDSEAIRRLVIYKTLEIYCGSAIEIEGDKWNLQYDRFRSAYDSEYSSFNNAYDTDGDGNISDSENLERPSFLSIGLVR
jgi:hypothetical protein